MKKLLLMLIAAGTGVLSLAGAEPLTDFAGAASSLPDFPRRKRISAIAAIVQRHGSAGIW